MEKDFFHQLTFGSKFKHNVLQRDKEYFDEKNESKSGQLVTSSNRKLTNLIPLNHLDFFNPQKTNMEKQKKQKEENKLKKKEEKEKEKEINEDEEDDDDEIIDQKKEKKDNNSIEIRREKKIFILGNNYPPIFESFEELTNNYSVRPYLIKNVEKLGFSNPTPVQMQVMPILLQDRECLVAAPTGSGKTLSYALPLLAKLKKPAKDGFRALVILPTSVLSQQITREFEKFSKGKDWRIVNLDKSKKQIEKKLQSKRNDILIATPKKLIELLNSSVLSLENVQYLILDEADDLLGKGFDEQIDEVISQCTNPNLVRGLFSATMPIEVENMAKSFLKDPITVIVGEKNAGSDTIDQSLEYVGSEAGKVYALRQLLKEGGIKPPILIFVQTVERAHALYKEFQFEDISIDFIHGKRTATQTKDVVNQFRLGKLFVLICTDVMARGIDFKGVSCVINYDFPTSTYSYIHRIGRCGRAGFKGYSKTYFANEDIEMLRNLAEVMKKSGCNVEDWMLKMKKLDKKKLENKKYQQREKIGSKKIFSLKGKLEIKNDKIFKENKKRMREEKEQESSKKKKEE